MYAETGLMLPLLQGFSQDFAVGHHHHLVPLPEDELVSRFHTGLPGDGSPSPMGNLVQTSSLSDYDLGGEGDLFNAPEPIIEEPDLELDPMVAAMISGGDDVMAAETLKAADMESIQNDQLLNDVFYDCKKELLAKSAIKEPFSELSEFLSDAKFLAAETGQNRTAEEIMLVATEGPLQKSVSSECLTSMEWINGCAMRPNFLDFQGMDLGAAFGMRRAYSEGDIQTLGNNNLNGGNSSIIQPAFERQLTISDFKSEERREKISRYMKKKSKRNFGRKIKYACRKALADSQPRVRGRFAKTEDCEIPKPHKQM